MEINTTPFSSSAALHCRRRLLKSLANRVARRFLRDFCFSLENGGVLLKVVAKLAADPTKAKCHETQKN